ncbi:MAG: VPS10 domain-containing protein, partial [Longimicrobiales bacterium]
MKPRRLMLIMCALLVSTGAVQAQTLDSTLLRSLRWRSIGPAVMAGRVTDVEGLPGPSKTFYVASVTGGIWKTTNNGVTYRPLFQNERVISMGDLAIAPSDTMQIWAGTGEEDARNSISPGGGIYKSTDGGLTWKLMGLDKTEHIGRIIVHPTNPNIVWVAAAGATWRHNPERGLYKTTDGGQTWRLVKFISDKAGFIDMVIHPQNPNVLFASSWERVRGPYFLKSGGPGSALWKTIDGGETWTEIKGGGFPETEKGRIGIAIALSEPRIMYAMVEAAPTPASRTLASTNAPAQGRGGGRGGAGEQRRSGLYRSLDGGQIWEYMNGNNTRPFYYSQVRVDTKNPNRVYFSSVPINFSDDGGRTVRNTSVGVHTDDHALWIDPNDPDRMVIGNDGGVAISFDRGGNWASAFHLPVGQFYAISYDLATPYRVCGGLQDNYSWCGPSRKAGGAITNHDWFRVSGGDGFVTAQDPRDPNIIYSESQGGNMGRLNYATGERITLQKPNWRDSHREYMDSIAVLWPDTTVQPSSQIRQRVADLRRRASRDSADLDLRYNWNTPYILSPHNADVFYAGANRVLKSTNKGEGLVPISPDLSKKDATKIRISTRETGGVTRDATGAETYGTIASITESPVQRGLLYAGTDDGNVWLSPDDGRNWTDLTARFKGLVPDTSYVSRIEASPHDANRFYVTFDHHRTGDFKPYIFMTTDGGRTFKSISSNLPTGGPDFVHVVREDLRNPNLLFAGTDVGAYVSLDRGASWQRFMEGLPTVPVHDLKIHPRERELIAGTHGRAIWIVDIAPLQELTPAIIAANAHLFLPRPASNWGSPPTGGEFTGQQYWQSQAPGPGADIVYWLGQAQQGGARVVITDARGDTMATMTGSSARGLQRVSWNVRGRTPPTLALSPSERRDSINTERRLAVVSDSLVKAGTAKEQVDRVIAQLRTAGGGGGGGRAGGGGGGGGGRGGQSGAWVERAGESPVTGGGRGAGAGAGAGAAAAGDPEAEGGRGGGQGGG